MLRHVRVPAIAGAEEGECGADFGSNRYAFRPSRGGKVRNVRIVCGSQEQCLLGRE